ncbi:MAG: hypothetical protein ACTIK4_13580 [Mesonia sp.]|uniref:hypothetical protein n=1 Tax=Mesonia sp. TaxID=1960830 RepID=UPI003F9A70E6
MMSFSMTFISCNKDILDETIEQQLNVDEELMNFEKTFKTINKAEFRASRNDIKPLFKMKRQTLLLRASKKLLLAKGVTKEALKKMVDDNTVIKNAMLFHFKKTQGKLNI